MKKLLLGILLLSFFFSANAQKNGSIYYYYKGAKVYFPVSYDRLVVGIKPGTAVSQLKTAVAGLIAVSADSIKETSNGKQMLVKLGRNKVTDISSLVSKLKQNSALLYARPVFLSPSGKYTSYSDEFIVNLKSSTNFAAVQALMNNTGCSLIKKYPFLDDMYILSAGAQANYDGLAMANLFYETGLFDYAEPNKIVYNALHVDPNDPLYNLQWAHKNTGSAAQYSGTVGADMKVQDAWAVTMGSPSIKVGVIDEGVDLTHPDLAANLLQGFNGATMTSGPGDGGYQYNGGAHGTNCAGVIAAIANNGIGVAGVAPNCKIIPAVIFGGATGDYLGDAAVAGSFDYVRINGADVISNSWGGGPVSSTIDDAIHRAVTLGRGGLGCVVLFSSGNDNDAVSYPGTNPEVISVGGINMCNQRKSPSSCDGENWWGANYGTGLDVVAPCVKIASTDIQGVNGYNHSAGTAGDYYNIFNGTSSACPNAAGVAALILSVNSSLTVAQATAILEGSCTKIPGYTFAANGAQPNGTWNNELGHGRVNALTAVQMAQSSICPHPTITAVGVTQPACPSPVTGTIVVTATGAGTLEYSLNGGAYQASNTFTGLAPDGYIVTARVQGGDPNCIEFYSGNPVVINPASSSIVFTAPTVTQPGCPLPAAGTIVVNATGNGALEYRLNSGAWQASNTFSSLGAGNYNISARLQANASCSAVYAGNPVIINAANTTLSTVSFTGAVAIPDGNSTGVNIPITVSGAGNVADLNFRLDANPAGGCSATVGNTNASVDHTFIGDLVFKLTSPQGTTVTIINRIGNGGNNFCTVTLDDEGGYPSIQSVTAAQSPVTGNFTPNSPLSAFDGENPNGNWVLNVRDLASIDEGSVRGFSLLLTTEAPCATAATSLALTASQPTACQGTFVSFTAKLNRITAPVGPVSGATVLFSIINNINGVGLNYSAVTNAAGEATVTPSLLAAGVYTVTANFLGTATLNPSTSNAVTQTITIPTATITPNGPTTFCAGGSVTLTANAGDSYLWSTNETTQSIVVTASGNYSVTVTTGGCQATSAITAVTVNPLPIAYNLSLPGGNPNACAAYSAWSYLRMLDINNTGAAITNYRMLVDINTQSLISSGKLRNDGGDLRFLSGCAEMPFWIESGLNTASTKIWVKVPSVAAASTTQVQMVYGNPSANFVTPNNASNVFESGLMALYTFTEGSGAVLNDRVGGFNMDITGTATWSTGFRPGVSSISGFAGGRVFLNGNGPALGSGSFTVIDFANSITPDGSTQGLVGNYNNDLANGWVLKHQGGPGEEMLLTNQGGNWCQSSGGAIPANQWQMLGARRNTGVTNTLFVNGANVGNICAGDNRNVDNSGPFEIGRSYNGQYAFNGSASLVAIYNTAMSDAAILELTRGIQPAVAPTITVGTELQSTSQTICSGSNAVINLSNSETGVNYQLYQDGNAVQSPKAGTTGSALSWTVAGLSPGAYVFTAKGTNATTSCSNNMNGSAAVNVNAPPEVSIAPDGPVKFCAGGSVNLNAGGVFPNYLHLVTPYAMDFAVGVATFGPSITTTPLNGDIVRIADNAPSYLACSQFGPGALAGKVALIDRGLCSYAIKVQSAQSAGAIAVIIINNVPGLINMAGVDPTITIPSIMVSMADGEIIKNLLMQGTVNGHTVAHTYTYLWSTAATTASINVSQTGTFTVTATDVNGCSATSLPVSVIVNPLPNAVATPTSQTICTGTAITTIVNSGNVAGTVYNWTRDNLAVTGIAANGSGNISGSLTNATAAPVTVTFIITPSYTNDGLTCTGTPVNATVTVNPTQYFVCPGNMTETITDVICFKAVNTPNPVYCGTLTKLTWKLTGATTLSSATSGINFLGLRNMNVGTTTVTYTATFTGGVVKTCSFTVLVKETRPPEIRCPADKDVFTDKGKCYKTGPVSLGTPTVNDNCGIASITNNAPAVYQKGENLVTWTVTDNSGNTATCVQKVTVYDNEVPTINCPANVVVNAGLGPNCSATQVTLPQPVFSDNCGVVTLTWAIVGVSWGSSGNSGINYIPTMDFAVGVSTVTYTAFDAAGNAKVCTFTVTVKDITAPTLTCPPAQTLCKVSNNNYNIPQMIQSDNCAIVSTTYKITGVTSRTGSGTNASGSFNQGVSTITWTVKDSHANTSTCATTVTVVATTSPLCNQPPPTFTATPAPVEESKLKPTSTEVVVPGLSITAWPNPTVNYFNLKVNSPAVETVEIRMYDMAGKLVQVKSGKPEATYILGEHAGSGTYIVEVTQGNKKQIVKLVKLN